MENDNQNNGVQNIIFYSGDNANSLLPKLISAEDAVGLRTNYENQEVKFQTVVNKVPTEILSFIISKDTLEHLIQITKDDNREFKGIALTPGYANTEESNGHTFIVSALGSEKNGDVIDSLPSDQDYVHILPIAYKANSHLYDHLDICPNVCPRNKDRLTMASHGNDMSWTRGLIKPKKNT